MAGHYASLRRAPQLSRDRHQHHHHRRHSHVPQQATRPHLGLLAEPPACVAPCRSQLLAGHSSSRCRRPCLRVGTGSCCRQRARSRNLGQGAATIASGTLRSLHSKVCQTACLLFSWTKRNRCNAGMFAQGSCLHMNVLRACFFQDSLYKTLGYATRACVGTKMRCCALFFQRFLFKTHVHLPIQFICSKSKSALLLKLCYK